MFKIGKFNLSKNIKTVFGIEQIEALKQCQPVEFNEFDLSLLHGTIEIDGKSYDVKVVTNSGKTLVVKDVK